MATACITAQQTREPEPTSGQCCTIVRDWHNSMQPTLTSIIIILYLITIMYFQKWNSVLAEMGDEWSSSCDWEHGQPSSPFSPFGSTGQNLYATTASGVNLTKAVVSWYNEKADYNYAGVSCSKVCGHYTQVGICIG